ncbi:MAG: tyrosine-type recombinase/integrase [Candidatus Tectomicrobia bacterium]|nr:tyrosine-type recombinase/integrase [Candidatus Tectomicrobia bacterium]
MRGARALTLQEVKEVAQSFYGGYAVRNRVLFMVGVNIGARISELIGLNVGDVYREGRVVELVTLRKAITKGRVERQIVLNAQVQGEILEFIAWKLSRDEALSQHAPLFVSRKGGRLTRVQAHRILKEVFGELSLEGKVTTHSLRKTTATALDRAGVRLRVIQEWLGHANLTTTQRYLEISQAELREAARSLNFSTHQSAEQEKSGLRRNRM